MKLSKITHLTKNDIIKNGSVFTPDYIVKIAYEWLFPYINNNDYIIDFGVGYGSFVSKFINASTNIIATDIDPLSIQLVNEMFPTVRTYVENSLINISRAKYQVPNDSKLIIIGNPPYNDMTSHYKKHEKGEFLIDNIVKSRDLGVSFLKTYATLASDYICVLHPLSYLIKKANFNSLSYFKNEYLLIKGVVFSSKHFESIKKSNIEFPVVLALYKREFGGMQNFKYIENFNFEILNSSNVFCLQSYKTIDGIIHKYPKHVKDNNNTLYFYTIRDTNALKRNRTFMIGNVSNGIAVYMDKLYQYAWLDYFKHHFKINDHFLIGNLSPLYVPDIERIDVKRELISYILTKNEVVNEYYKNNKHDLLKAYHMTEICEFFPLLEQIIVNMQSKFE